MYQALTPKEELERVFKPINTQHLQRTDMLELGSRESRACISEQAVVHRFDTEV